MRTRKNNYKELEQSVVFVLISDIIMFIFFLIASANGITWLRITLFILTFIMAILCLVLLFISGELTRQRSLWLTSGFAAIALCSLLAFALNYPSPDPYAGIEPTTSESASVSTPETTDTTTNTTVNQ